jgi:hypothetical protein
MSVEFTISRILAVIAVSVLASCTEETPLNVAPCLGVEQVVGQDDPTPHGDTATSVSAELARFERAVLVRDETTTFVDTYSYGFSQVGQPRRMLTSTSPIEPWCIDGDMLVVDFDVEMTSALGLEMAGTATVLVDAETGTHRTFLSLGGEPTVEAYVDTDDNCDEGPAVGLSFGVSTVDGTATSIATAQHEGGVGLGVDIGIGICGSEAVTWETTD